MIAPLRHLLGWMVSAFGSREALILENLALRQQLLSLRAKPPRRRLTVWHKLFWVVLRRLWAGWKTQLAGDGAVNMPAHRFLLLDRDAKFGDDVVSSAKAMGSEPVRTGFRSPWQNGVAERWVGSCRRDLLDNVIILNERHLKRLMSEYVSYYHEDRTHLGRAKDTPAGRPTAIRPAVKSKIRPSLGWVDCTTVTTWLRKS